MSTQARVSANRRNAEKSTGPRTAEGKAVVAEEGGYSPSCEIAKQSQSPAVEGGHRPQCETAKQSQSEGVSSSKCEGSSGVGSAAEDNLSRQTKPIHAAGTVCSVPARASRSTRILPMTLNRGRDAHATATPCGVTTSGPDPAKQSQFAAQEGGHKPPCEIAKQSQSPAVKGGHRPPCEAAEQSQSEEAASVTCEVSRGPDQPRRTSRCAKQSQWRLPELSVPNKANFRGLWPGPGPCHVLCDVRRGIIATCHARTERLR